jgi:hypothetical protein
VIRALSPRASRIEAANWAMPNRRWPGVYLPS